MLGLLLCVRPGGGVAEVLTGNKGSGAPGASDCGAEITSDVLDAVPNHNDYPRLSRLKLKSG